MFIFSLSRILYRTMSSSSEADSNDQADEIPSSPLGLRQNATDYDSRSNDEESSGSEKSRSPHNSPKRRRYEFHAEDQSVEVSFLYTLQSYSTHCRGHMRICQKSVALFYTVTITNMH